MGIIVSGNSVIIYEIALCRKLLPQIQGIICD